MLNPLPEIDSFLGTYSGAGAWIDDAGESKPYGVHQSISISERGLTVDYTHDFYQEGSTTSGAFVLQRQGVSLLKVFMGGSALGHGYVFANYLHYYVKVGEVFVQAGYLVSPAGLEVNGSSSSNAQGRFIAWHESLQREGRN